MTNLDRIEALEESTKSHDRAIRGHEGRLGLEGRLVIAEKQLTTINWGLRIMFVAILIEILERAGVI